MDDNERRESAIKRLKDRREFWTHLFMYVIVNALLVVIWAVGTKGYFWPMWSMIGWGIGIGAHAFETFRAPISESAIQREMDRGTSG